MLHFEQGNVWGMAQPSLQLKGQLGGTLSCISPLPRPAVILVPTQLCITWASPFTDLAFHSTKSPQEGQRRPTGALMS